MSRYDNIECPVCEEKFKDGDDIVVCPICGAPHHRSCYMSEGKCHFEAEHASGKQWEPREKQYEETANDPKKCPKCSAPNPADGIFCQVCGYTLRNQAPEKEENPYSNYDVPPIDPTAFTTPYGGVDPEEEIDGVTAKELALFVGDNSHYYVPRIKSVKKEGRNVSWNWSSFFFGFMYYYNRKMYLIGTLVLALFILSMLPNYVYMYHLMLNNADLILSEGIYVLLYPESLNYDGLQSLITVCDFASYVYTGVKVLSALFANKLYTNFVYRKIAEIREGFDENVDKNSPEYTNALAGEGRTNRPIAIGALIALIAANSFVSMVISYLVFQTII